ncbi:MAG: DUF2721 domain-containing protein [Luteolibacter sp.]
MWGGWVAYFGMTLEVSTPALLFPAISLLFLSYTNRFLHLAALIRRLHGDWLDRRDTSLIKQIRNLRKRLVLIRGMQFLGAVSLFLCVLSMVSVVMDAMLPAVISFGAALVLMGGSLACLMVEVWISGGALRIMLAAMEGEHPEDTNIGK